MKRSKAREICFHILYETQFQPGEDAEKLTMTYLEQFAEEETVTEKDLAFILGEIEGTIAHLDEIDAKIEENLVGWKLSRLSKVDLSILRLAVYEILFAKDIPENVSINEAVELGKNYSEETSGSFINGVLANFVPQRD